MITQKQTKNGKIKEGERRKKKTKKCKYRVSGIPKAVYTHTYIVVDEMMPKRMLEAEK